MLGFLFVILLVIPLTVYLVQQRQETTSHAIRNTNLSFIPSDKTAAIGDKVSFDILISPGTNQVNFVKLALKFDPTKLSTTATGFTVDSASNLAIQEGPVVNNGVLLVALTVGSDPTKVIQTDTKIGTITFDVVGPSDLPTQITFDSTQTQIRSINGKNNDAFNENVFLSGVPASVTIQPAGGGSPTPTPTGTTNTSPTPTPTGTTNASPTPTVPTDSDQAPICSSLTPNVSTSGVAPYAISFTANGTDSDGTINKVTFNFGEGSVQDIVTGSGITTKSVNPTLSHTYSTAGNYTVRVILTDDKGKTSNSVSCTATITITSNGSGSTSTTNNNTVNNSNSTGGSTTTTTNASGNVVTTEVSPSPLPATGPAQKVVGFGMLGGLLFLIGTLLFLAL